MPDANAQVKGMSYLSYVTPLQRDRGALWAAVEAKLSPASRQFFSEPIFANNWYPRVHMHELLRAFKQSTNGDANELRELGGMAARYQVHLVYRMFLKFATPAMVFNRASSVWSRQSTIGQFFVVEEAEDHLIGELDDPDLPDGLIELMAGWADTIIAMLGRTPFKTTYQQLSSRRWRFRVSWVSR